MSDAKIDLSELALDREPVASGLRNQRSATSLFSRWLVPVLILSGFGALIYWAVLPNLITGIDVTVVKVRVENGTASTAGTPLFRASGWVEPRPTPVYVSSLISGTVESLLVVEDQTVHKGELVATLIDDDAQLKLRAAQADYLNKQALLEQAQIRLKSAEIDYQQPVQKQLAIARAEHNLASINTFLNELPQQIIQAEAELTFAIEDLASKKEAGTAISRIEVEKATAAQASAAAKQRELQIRKAGLGNQQKTVMAELASTIQDLDLNNDAANELGQARAGEKVAQAQVELAAVKVDEAKLELERTKIVSPADGKVMKLMTSPGGHLSGGPGHQGSHVGGVAVMLYNPASLQTRVDVRFEDVKRVSLGQPVIIESPALEMPVKGVVLRMNPVADIQKNTLEVKVSVDEANQTLKPEMLMNITFLSIPSDEDTTQANSADSRVYVPDSVVRREAESTYVWILDGGNKKAKKQAIVVDSLVLDGWVEVVKGLNVSSQVIKSSSEPLVDQARVSVSEFEGN
ncbi:MAG: hypothetical protein CMJ76_06110 [Planctomycetaceae bacterium]|nr:hypothetical protein [Planctomycetaceae bacterium]